MISSDLHRLSDLELLRHNASVRRELQERGLARTASSVEGELGEYLAMRVYGGELMPPSTTAYDLTDPAGRRIQVKVRSLDPGVERFFTFKRIDFDLAVLLRFARRTLEIEWAREFDSVELQELCTSVAAATDHRLTTVRAATHGRDVTAEFRTALSELDA